MNPYARVSEFRDSAGVETRLQDADILRELESASRWVDHECRRTFFQETRTRYYSGTGGTRLRIPTGIVSVSSLKVDWDGNDSYEVTLAASTDYYLADPDNAVDVPYQAIDLNSNGTQVSYWPRRSRSVQIVGVFGWPATVVAVTSSTGGAATVQANPLTAGATTLAILDGDDIHAGDVLQVESEAIYVSATTSTLATLVRGHNGTTAAAHIQTTPIYRLEAPATIRQVTIRQAMRVLWQQQSGYMGGSGLADGGGQFASAVPYSALKYMLDPYRVQVAA